MRGEDAAEIAEVAESGRIPQDLQYNDQTGRPMPMENGGRVIQELV